MLTLQAYFFRQILGPLTAVLLGLALVALLTQGLSRLDIIVEQQQTGFQFFYVTLLAMPQVISLILPIALFFAIAFALNRLLGENEMVSAFAAGMSRWQLISPILKLAALAALCHLALNAIIQPASYRELREVVFAMRADVATSLVREGAFTSPASGITIFARGRTLDRKLRDLLIQDDRPEQAPITLSARRSEIRIDNGEPALVLWGVQAMLPKEDGSFDLVESDQQTIALGEDFKDDSLFVLEQSDRYLGELFFPDPTDFYDQRNINEFIAEGHARIAQPLLNVAMALIAAAALFGSQYSRLGYGRVLIAASVTALLVRLFALGIEAASAETPALLPLQYAFPVLVSIGALAFLMGPPRRSAQRQLAQAGWT